MQNHGPGAGLYEGQEKGKFTVLFQTLTVDVDIEPGRFFACFVQHSFYTSRLSMLPRSRAVNFSFMSGY
jgi:hypothetical protein